MFQDPYASLDPRMRVRTILSEPLAVQTSAPGAARPVRSCSARSGCRAGDRLYPHEFSGGQRQRIGLARALALKPQADRRRRAGLGARRLDPVADPQPHEAPAGVARPHLHRHLARPVGRALPRRPHRRDVPRQPGRDRHRPRHLRAHRPSLHGGAARGHPGPDPGPRERQKRGAIVLGELRRR